jgi:hypothetical protein
MDESTKKQFLTDLRSGERGGDREAHEERGPQDESARDPNDENERPTLNPPFDLEAFARAHASSSPDITTARPPASPAIPKAISTTPPLPPPPSADAQPNAKGTGVGAGGRFPSALWMVDSLASSVPPPALEANASVAQRAAPSPSTPAITQIAVEDPAAEMRERASLGDYTGALEMAELLLAADPGHEEAVECMANYRAILEKMYSAKLGPLDRAPIVVVPRAQLRWLSIDHRAGFILSLIDGTSPIEMIIDVSGMPKLDALRILHELVQQRIVSFRA